MTITFIRHGETEWNRIGRVQGISDIPLNDTGRRQAEEAGEILREQGEQWTTITSSHLARARETAQIIADNLGMTLDPAVPLLREQHYGEAEGVSMEEFYRRWPDRDWEGGETSADLHARAQEALDHLEQLDPNGKILAVSHGALIRRVVTVVTGLEHNDVPAIANTGLTTLAKNGTGNWEVVTINNEPAAEQLPQRSAGFVQVGEDTGVCTPEGSCN